MFDLTLELDPEVAAGVAWFDLWDADRQQSVVGSTAFNPYPVVRPVPAGLYSLDVTIKPPTAPYVSKQGVVIPVYPSRPAQKKVTVT